MQLGYLRDLSNLKDITKGLSHFCNVAGTFRLLCCWNSVVVVMERAMQLGDLRDLSKLKDITKDFKSIGKLGRQGKKKRFSHPENFHAGATGMTEVPTFNFTVKVPARVSCHLSMLTVSLGGFVCGRFSSNGGDNDDDDDDDGDDGNDDEDDDDGDYDDSDDDDHDYDDGKDHDTDDDDDNAAAAAAADGDDDEDDDDDGDGGGGSDNDGQ
ncbi:hypothetical protein ElyMa_003160600 [Elysia marginata]|uniref:Uncharacterized protein n=1 Tax=Elysia marginata TaxID=1093978 RepID=A0AAV4IXL0_9GAST|nr:hypothetical protein ElyMa_003160600 [Elysia marginata]